ncbi:hypothetical protein BKA83DRAFT_4498011 [Pisolithus microcarpus]|nr:hypothetical protein BKA83DRAFT_4498011 [Pisolithus microcarpus]
MSEAWSKEYAVTYEIPMVFGQKRTILWEPKTVAYFFMNDTWSYVIIPGFKAILAKRQAAGLARLIDYLATIVKYKALDSVAEVPLPNFPSTSCPSYDQNLVLRPQESRQDHSRRILPLVFLHKLHKFLLGWLNVPWKTLLDLLYVHQYMLVDWPVGVPAVGADFNVKCLNADELRSLTLPFLKEQMGNDYLSEVPGDNEDVDDDHLVPVPGLSFYLWDWSTGSLILCHRRLELMNQPQ